MGKIERKKVSKRFSSYYYILDTVPNPIVEVDENLIINLANREALNRWPSIIEGKSFYYTIIFGENEKPEDCFVEKTFKLKKTQSLEIKTKKGEIFLFKTNYIKEKASQRVVIHIQDISERKHMVEILRESEARFHLAFENANIGMCLVDLNGRLTRVNNQMCEIFGYNREELESMTVNDIAHPDDLNISSNFIRRASSRELEHTQFEKRYFHKRGHIVWGQVSSSLVRDLQGVPLYFISHVQDITEHKRIEDALKKSEERYKTLVENQGEGIALVNEQEEFLYANPSAENIFGLPPGTLVGRNLKDFLTEENYKVASEQTKLRQKGIKSTYEIEIIQPSGKKCAVLVTATPEFDDKKRFKNTFGIFRDISEQKRMQEEILKSKKFESLGFLAAGIAHDFNNLLTIILGNIELAKISLVTENKTFKFLLKSEETVHEAVELVQRFLIFSEDKSGLMKTESVGKIIQNSADRVLSDSNIICSYEIPDDLWSLECNVDQIYYTINNLILNAKEALSNKGKIEIKVSNEVVKANQIGTLKSGKYIKLSIKDYGTGISKENLSRIFDPYFSTKDKLTEKGLGLGLTTIYSVIMKHKGYINVASEKGIGTTVEIYLPALKIDSS